MKRLNLHVLIAEDDADDSEIIEKSFSRHPAFDTISLVKNGKELLEFLQSKAPRPDVILTDINMPIVNGLEVLKLISLDDELRKITRFAYSTSINPLYKLKCLQYGARSFIVKPVVLEEFDDIPQRIIDEMEQD